MISLIVTEMLNNPIVRFINTFNIMSLNILNTI